VLDATKSSHRPFQAAVSIAELEALPSDVPADFPGADMLRDGELLAYLLILRRLFDSEGLRPRGVIHVGASVGEELGVYLLLGFSRALMIEANPDVIPALERNVAALNALATRFDEPMGLAPPARAQAVHCAVGAENGVVMLNLMDAATLSSILPLNADALGQDLDGFAVVRRQEVPLRRLDDLRDTLAHGAQAADFNVLRLNIQGAELMALQGAEQWLANIELVFTEINITERYDGCPGLEELDAFLTARGFVRRWGYQWDPSGGDAVYIRRR